MDNSTHRDLDDGREGFEELEDWAADLPDQFNVDSPTLTDPWLAERAVAEAAVRSEYATGGELIYLADGRRCVAWDAIGDYLEGPDAQPQYAGAVGLVIAQMMAAWEGTGEIPGLVLLKK